MELGGDAQKQLEEEIAEQKRRIQVLNFLDEGDVSLHATDWGGQLWDSVQSTVGGTYLLL